MKRALDSQRLNDPFPPSPSAPRAQRQRGTANSPGAAFCAPLFDEDREGLIARRLAPRTRRGHHANRARRRRGQKCAAAPTAALAGARTHAPARAPRARWRRADRPAAAAARRAPPPSPPSGAQSRAAFGRQARARGGEAAEAAEAAEARQVTLPPRAQGGRCAAALRASRARGRLYAPGGGRRSRLSDLPVKETLSPRTRLLVQKMRGDSDGDDSPSGRIFLTEGCKEAAAGGPQ